MLKAKRYLKLFEKYEKPKNTYWKVRIDTPYFEISLGKIGMVEDEQKVFLVHRKFFSSDDITRGRGIKYTYIGLKSF